jgi:hypothetical protein
MEGRVRQVLRHNELKRQELGPGMNVDGLVYFPAVSLRSVKVLLPGRGYQDPLTIEIPMAVPAAG